MNYQQREVPRKAHCVPTLLAVLIDAIFYENVILVVKYLYRRPEVDAMLDPIDFILFLAPFEGHSLYVMYNMRR